MSSSPLALRPARPPFIACRPDPVGADVVLYGIPFEGRVNQRGGAALGPGQIRRASDLLETYVPALGRDLADLAIADAGDFQLPSGAPRSVLEATHAALRATLNPEQRWLFLGGDHTITAPVVWTALDHYPELRVVQFDAHPDLRGEFLGEPWNYASAMTRVLDRLPAERLFQLGLRTGDRQEWEPPRGTRVFPAFRATLVDAARHVLDAAGHHPLHVTLDIDVLDPAVAPGTGSPEPGGASLAELLDALRQLATARIVSFDLVEVSPPLDPTGRTAVLAAYLVREVAVAWWGTTRRGAAGAA